MAGRTVTDMNTLNVIMSVVASHGEHHGYWFPFAFLWLALLGVGIWFLVRGRRSVRRRAESERERSSPSATPAASSRATSTASGWSS